MSKIIGRSIPRLSYFAVLVVCLVVGILLVVHSGSGSRVSEAVTEPTGSAQSVTGQKGTVATPAEASDQSDANSADAVTNTLTATAATDEVRNEKPAVPDVTTVAAPAQVSQEPALQVALSVNGMKRGSVTLSKGSNHCDVLSQALRDGLIANLDMRYYAAYKTQGVFVIDGIGDSNSIWWTYTVNSKSLPYGCSAAQVHDGDNVNWEYIK